MHFRILKKIATSGFLTALECTKFVSAGAPPRTSLGQLTVLPRLPSWFKGAILLRRRERKGSKGIGKWRKEKKSRNTFHQIPATPLA